MKIRLTEKMKPCAHFTRSYATRQKHGISSCTHDLTRKWTIDIGFSLIDAIRVTLVKSYKYTMTDVVLDSINHSLNGNGKRLLCES